MNKLESHNYITDAHLDPMAREELQIWVRNGLDYYKRVERTDFNIPHRTALDAIHIFKTPFPIPSEVDLLSAATMDLLLMHGYPYLIHSETGTVKYCKFNIRLRVKKEYEEEFSFMVGVAIPLTSKNDSPKYENEERLPYITVYREIYRQLLLNSDKYNGDCVVHIGIRLFFLGDKSHKPKRFLDSDRRNLLKQILIE